MVDEEVKKQNFDDLVKWADEQKNGKKKKNDSGDTGWKYTIIIVIVVVLIIILVYLFLARRNRNKTTSPEKGNVAAENNGERTADGVNNTNGTIPVNGGNNDGRQHSVSEHSQSARGTSPRASQHSRTDHVGVERESGVGRESGIGRESSGKSSKKSTGKESSRSKSSHRDVPVNSRSRTTETRTINPISLEW